MGHLEPPSRQEMVAVSTGLEPATSGLTGRRANQLRYETRIYLGIACV